VIVWPALGGAVIVWPDCWASGGQRLWKVRADVDAHGLSAEVNERLARRV